MKVIVLAGGIGKRMWPIKTDKCLIPFLGKPLLYHNLKKIKQAINPDEVIVVANPNSKDEVSKILSEVGLTGTIALQNEPRGMADAILSAKDLIEGEILVVNAEDIVEEEIYQQVGRGGSEVVFASLTVKNYFPGGYLKLEKDQVVGIVEKPREGMEPSDQIKLVIDYFKDGKKLISYLEKATSEHDDVYEVALGQMIADGVDIKVAKYSGPWIPLKYPWQILDITTHFLSNIEQNISSGAKVSEKAEISGPVVIEDGAKIFEGATIKGPVFIGKGVMVGTNNLIRESDIEEDCVTGFNSDITRSYIGPNSWFHTNYIGDSVIEGNFGMGSGAVLANFRLDDHTIRVKIQDELVDSGRNKLGLIAGKGSRVGVNASTMPGTKIGSNSLVGPGVTLYNDIEDNKKILVKQEYEITEHTPALTSYDQFRDKIK